MSETPSTFARELARQEAYGDLLDFLEEQTAQVNDYLDGLWDYGPTGFSQFVGYFSEDVLPWLWDDELSRLREVAKAGDGTAFMQTWDCMMDTHPERSEGFWDVTARDPDLPDLCRKGAQYDWLKAKLGELEEENAALKAKATE